MDKGLGKATVENANVEQARVLIDVVQEERLVRVVLELGVEAPTLAHVCTFCRGEIIAW